MRLISVEIDGYKRFSSKSKINVDGKLISIVGPNEAGKTSVLEAIRLLRDSEPVQYEFLSRRLDIEEGHVVVKALFLLEPDDIEHLNHLYSPSPEHIWLEVSKRRDGQLELEMEPRPHRDIESRNQLGIDLERVLQSPKVRKEIEDQEVGSEAFNSEDVEAVQEALASQNRTISDAIIDDLEELIESLKTVDGRPKYSDAIFSRAQRVMKHERLPHPYELARALAAEGIPKATFFDDEARSLESKYDLSVHASSPPKALSNLAGVAELNLSALLQAIEIQEDDRIAEILEEANNKLAEVYAAWTHTGVRPHLQRAEGTTLSILVSNQNRGYMKFNERSAGLRSFVSLVASCISAPEGRPPIFLVDEAEQHLHYDAQADLIEVFNDQDAVPQIIYTTHSAGCLPDDLGADVRIVEPIPDSDNSQIRNSFWTDEPGFSPLLLGMGASTLAFFPTRDAVICEGPTELVMLGSLIREATDSQNLQFQIVPGSANARPARIAGFDLEAPGVAWLVDGDDGGRKLTKKIHEEGVPMNRIIPIGGASNSGLTVEDLVSAEVYASAVNEEIGRRGASERISALDIQGPKRVDQVESWCVENGVAIPGKVAVAHHVVRLKSEHTIVDPDQASAVRDLHSALRDAILRAEDEAPA